MIKIWTLGGLGNQLFHYALYHKLKSLGKDVCLDLSDFTKYKKHQGFELTKVFDLEVNICNEDDLKQISYRLPSRILNKIRRIIFHKLGWRFIVNNTTLYEQSSVEKNLKLFELNNIRLVGYWQREGYLASIRFDLQSALMFRVPHTKVKYLYELNQDESILLHVRGGDYVSLGWTLGVDYYLDALKEFIHIKNPNYYIITDDFDYLNSLELPIDYKVIDDYQKEDSYINMYLFSKAKNIILGNSTFSWWGAYLNLDAKTVIVSKTWIPVMGYETIIHPSEWIKK